MPQTQYLEARETGQDDPISREQASAEIIKRIGALPRQERERILGELGSAIETDQDEKTLERNFPQIYCKLKAGHTSESMDVVIFYVYAAVLGYYDIEPRASDKNGGIEISTGWYRDSVAAIIGEHPALTAFKRRPVDLSEGKWEERSMFWKEINRLLHTGTISGTPLEVQGGILNELLEWEEKIRIKKSLFV